MLLKAYCGLMLYQIQKTFICIDRYTNEVKCSGTLEKCSEYFNNYMDQVSERRN